MIRDTRLPQFQTDYIISWDVSDKDHPRIVISELRRDKPGSWLEVELLGTSYDKTGAVSLHQLLEQHDALKRAEAERMKDAEALRKTFGQKEEEDKNAT
jgi:hypothetical protein